MTTTTASVTVVPANEASWADLQAIFGTRGDPASCQCQYFKTRDSRWRAVPLAERTARLRSQAACDRPGAESTSGLVAYAAGEPAGWCAVEPRLAYERLRHARVPWAGRDEDKDDPTVWAVTCFVIRKGFRRQGISRALAAATPAFARDRGARAIEGYPMITEPGKEITWNELYVGHASIFTAAGYTEVSHPFPRRVVMRIDFQARG